MAAAPTKAKSNSDFEGQTYSFADALAQSVPEIAALVKQAAAGGWDPTRFADALQATQWWKKNSQSARSVIATQKSDPATYTQQMLTATNHVTQMAGQMGIKLTPAQIKAQATSSLFQGMDDTALSYNLSKSFSGNATGNGTTADVGQQLRTMAASYGVPVTQAWLNTWEKNALMTGDTTLTQAQRSLIGTASTTYPALAKELADGTTTVSDIADPYKAAMAQTLEIDEKSIALTDPMIQKALTNPATVAPAKPGAAPATTPGATVTPLWQFQQTLKQDPRWGKTDNAKQTAYGMMADLGKSFGFST